MIGTKISKTNFNTELYTQAAEWCNKNNATIEEKDLYFLVIEIPEPIITIADYDQAIESHLLMERIARGYTSREPSEYLKSSVSRWSQDALDWVTHRDEVMLYAMEVMNAYEAGEEVPSLEEFKANIPIIHWTIE